MSCIFSCTSFAFFCFRLPGYYWTAFTSRSSKCCQIPFLTAPSSYGGGKSQCFSMFHRGVGVLLTLRGLLTCCRWWPVKCPAETGMWRPFGCEADGINCAAFSLKLLRTKPPLIIICHFFGPTITKSLQSYSQLLFLGTIVCRNKKIKALRCYGFRLEITNLASNVSFFPFVFLLVSLL